MEWNAGLYETKHGFVAEYGKGLLEFIAPDPQQSILDLGCGTGTLTHELSALAGSVLGVDASPEMVAAAKQRFPRLEFMVADALDLPFADAFDIVFSNAVFHWIPDHDLLLKALRRALKPHGRLICEFGVHGNVATIEQAFSRACAEAGHGYSSRFTFPEPEDFLQLLDASGFACEHVSAYDRPTLLHGGGNGLCDWMRQFFASDLTTMTERGQQRILDRVEELTRARLWNGDAWVADYKRLRVVAHI